MSLQTLPRKLLSEPVLPAKDLAMERLAGALRQVREACPEFPVLAIHWMHLKQPIHPVQEEMLVGEEDRWTRSAVLCRLPWRFLMSLLYGFCLLFRLVQMRFWLRRPLTEVRARGFDVVAKSWSMGSASSGTEEDFYYGDLQKRLAARGVSMLLLCGNATGRDWKAFALGNASDGRFCRLPEGCVIPLSAPLKMSFLQWKSSLRLLRAAAGMADPFSKQVAFRAALDCMNRQNLPQGLTYWMGRNAVRLWRPKVFITLYEGYGWEQCAWAGVKETDSTCRTVGFQHTVLFKHALELLHPGMAKLPHARPDQVLCSGPRAAAMLAASHPRSERIPFGSFRKMPASDVLHRPDPDKRTVLVLPEGYVQECRLLFNHALQAAGRLPDVRFVFRCHPILPFEKVRPLLDQDPDGLPNVEVSRRPSITEDFSAASALLYRGSSSVLYAIMYGLKPIYLHHDSYREVDPLFELTAWKERVRSPEELVETLRRYQASGTAAPDPRWLEALDYVKNYIQPVENKSVDRFLSSTGLKREA